MSTADKSNKNEDSKEPFKRLGLESIAPEKESLLPAEESFLRARQCRDQPREIGCESRVFDELVSAACDCRGDGCCC